MTLNNLQNNATVTFTESDYNFFKVLNNLTAGFFTVLYILYLFYFYQIYKDLIPMLESLHLKLPSITLISITFFKLIDKILLFKLIIIIAPIAILILTSSYISHSIRNNLLKSMKIFIIFY